MNSESAPRRALLLAVAAVALAATSSTSLGAQGAKRGPPLNPSVALPTGMPMPKTPKMPTTFEGLFAERSDRAVRALGYLRCVRNTMGAIEAGLLGRVPRAWLLVCVEHKDEWRGVFTEAAEDVQGGLRVMGQFSLKEGRATSTPIDTNRVVSAARSLVRGHLRTAAGRGEVRVHAAGPAAGRLQRGVVPPDAGQPGARGGRRGLAHPDDRRRHPRARAFRSTPAIRTFAVDRAAPELVLESPEDRVPLLSELMIAHLALDGKSRVVLRTRQYESVFSRGSRAPQHTPRR
jgi:hypothetical protein